MILGTLLLWGLAACGGGGGSGGGAPAANPPGTGGNPPNPPNPPSNPPDVTAPAFVGDPVVTPSPSGFAPLTGTLSITVDEEAVITVEVDDGDRTFELPTPTDPVTDTVVSLLGMRPDKTHQITVKAVDAAGNEAVNQAAQFVTPPLPADFPPLHFDVLMPDQMEPGLTFFATIAELPGGARRATLMMLDDAGEVVWYYQNPEYQMWMGSVTRSGTILFFEGRGDLFEIDLFGSLLNHWHAAGLNEGKQPPAGSIVVRPSDPNDPYLPDAFHHELFELPEEFEGDFVALTTEMREYPDYPFDELDPSITVAVTKVVGDRIIEFKRDGTITRMFSLHDMLDPYRLVYDSLLTFWDGLYGGRTADWTHGNGLALDVADDSYLMSMRHQDALIKFDRSTGELRWILGDPRRWEPPWQSLLLTPVGTPFEWPFHLHAPAFTGDGEIAVFDNGNYREIPPDTPASPGDWYSRGVVYKIDEGAGTVEQAWSYGEPGQDFYSGVLGGAMPLLSTGNVLLTEGRKSNSTHVLGHVFEVTRSSPSEIVFDLRVEDESGVNGYTVYRADRLSLFE